MKINHLRQAFLILVIVASGLQSLAREGMWIPYLLAEVFGEMQQSGIQLTPEQIYDINNSSLKDNIVHFDGGCTAELISRQGLILTNHHCGYGEIQSHSTVENDYLTNGFWAKSFDNELPNPGLTATFIVSLEDVTERVLMEVPDFSKPEERAAAIKKNIAEIMKQYNEEANEFYNFEIKPFFLGNQFILITKKHFKDVRLVGAPPSSIGKFGADTDNWMWPRHTGDFSLFRIYASPKNQPAHYSSENQPYQTEHSLKVSLSGIQPGDFTMVYGFPGRTQQYLPSYALEYTLNVGNPAKIAMRDQSLAVINAAMNSSAELRIKYAAKQSRISNAWKKWIGESKGLTRLDAIAKKQEYEERLQGAMGAPRMPEYFKTVLPELKTTHQQIEKYQLARDLFIEVFYYGPEFLRFADGFNRLIDLVESDTASDATINAFAAKMKENVGLYFKDYDAAVDQQLAEAMFPLYAQFLADDLQPDFVGSPKLIAAAVEGVFTTSQLVDKEKTLALLNNPKAAAKKIKKDPAFKLSKAIADAYFAKVKNKHAQLSAQLEHLYTVYMDAQMQFNIDNKLFYPDANSTLRVAFGQVEGYEPQDGARYHYQTTLDGVMEKENPEVYEFNVPEKLKQLWAAKDFGQYGENGKMPVCFVASNHTTGGNSGSPALDAEGNLIGLNFDRVWEGTMSDLMFDPERCRNIMVDIRYVLFIIDKFAGAINLIEEIEFADKRPKITMPQAAPTPAIRPAFVPKPATNPR